MCGFTIYLTKKNIDIKKLNNVEHRGPDKTIIEIFKHNDYNIGLSFNRLAIIDLFNGEQPFIYKDKIKTIYLLCNGEIYNYKKLIKKYNFNTNSDCKTILYLYLLKNNLLETLLELDGEFSFVLIEIIENNIDVYFCRDRFGIRPLFYHIDDDGYYFSSELKGLPFDGLGQQVEPRKLFHTNLKYLNFNNYYTIGQNVISKYNNIDDDNFLELLCNIKSELIQSVKDRICSERPIGALLSGGLDSSLICGIASKFLKLENKRLNTFSIGMTSDSPDIINARKVAQHINSIHHEIIIPPEKWLESLKDTIKQIETYDITTIRASTGQYLISKWISENTDIKVILNGDLSDELTSGYIYFYNTPNSEEAHLENIRLLNEIHNYDVLRVDRGISAFGLESRVPFASQKFVDLYLSIDKNLRVPIKGKRIEKYLLRKSFDEGKYSIIPLDVLYRQKEAFSDGVSCETKSWFEYIKDYVDKEISNEEFNKQENFHSKESYFYYKIFKEYYPNSSLSIKFWLPKWTTDNNGDPSARKLNIYKNST